MKKLGKKISFLTKIMLVLGLLVSNLSSLSVVFAYEATGAVEITLSDDMLAIKYNDELAENVEEVNVNVYENYTYLDNTSIDEVESNYNFTSEKQIIDGVEEEMSSLEKFVLNGLEMTSVITNVFFDGLYEVKVEITDGEGVEIDSAVYSYNVTHDSGLEFSVYDGNATEIHKLENGKYPVTQSNSKVNVVARVLSGGLKPTDKFVYDGNDYEAIDLLGLEFIFEEVDFIGNLYGDYTLPVEVKLLDSNNQEVVYSDSLSVLYESYSKNADELNMALSNLDLDKYYHFDMTQKDGFVYVLLNNNRANTMLDLYELAEEAIGENEFISYVLSNSQYADVLSTYDETSELTLSEYLDTILLDDTAMLSLGNDVFTITFKVIVVADLNNDHVLTQDDLLELMEQSVGNKEVDLSKSDLTGDGKVNVLDVMYLEQVVESNNWDVVLNEVNATLDSKLVLENDELVSGDEFTVDYVLSLTDYAVSGISGALKYDEEMLELVSVVAKEGLLGTNKDGKFVYLGNEELSGTVTVDEENNEVVTTTDYVMLTATFRALRSGTSEVTLETPEYFNGADYLVVEETEVSVLVNVLASDNNNLSSLTVAGQTITLVDDVLEYEITVLNEVTTLDIEAITENVAANITSIVSPEELAEGENTVTITVVSESGVEKVYTIVVTREKAPEKETTTTQVNYNDYYNDYEEEVEITPEPSEKLEDTDVKEEEEKESNLSRIIIIILILLVIAGLIYLIFKDEDDDETKKVNKDINRLKKEEFEPKNNNNTKVNKDNRSEKVDKVKGSKNNKKER